MRTLGIVVSMSITAGVCAGQPSAPPAKPRVDPRMISVQPFTGQKGETFQATVRGSGLREAKAAFLGSAPLAIHVESTEPEPPGEAPPGRNRTPVDLVKLRVEVAPEARPGRYQFRLITPDGISNSLPLYISEHPVIAEPGGSHETPDSAISVQKLPAVYAGRLTKRGETDFYAFDVQAGDTVTFAAVSGLPSTGAPGGNAQGFDPVLSIFEPSGSWFDRRRINRIAFNDESLWVVGRPTDPELVHTFKKAGRYLLRIEAFSGQGGPDYNYQLRMIPGQPPAPAASSSRNWEERSYTRKLSSDRLNELAERGGKPKNQKSIETYRAAAVPAAEAPLFKLPATLEGALTSPGETHRARFNLDGPQDIAIEIETLALAPPLFNPIVRLLDPAGQEVATSVMAGRGACSGELSKSLQAKTLVPLRDPGGYIVEMRDATADLADPGFRYRVQLRQQIPHIGQVRIDEDHINLAAGEAKTVRVTFDREENFQGAVAVLAEALPPGIQAVAGADFEPDKDPPRFPGKRERYTPRTERTVVVFTAAPDAPATTAPQVARLVVRPVVDGKPGIVLGSKEIPIWIIGKP